ncbi:hypothetical protein [Sphingobacterium humi]|uniref:Uncharacterized protein n=1 Tax=Sphingobacterium humi TaxID=1796905 RepID=A0A6N8L332_9SPHI|nr:hypothetical protein [Sphingobacterium humi]MVZ63494.1 hypothetical protein [Sphingobacterium humi]
MIRNVFKVLLIVIACVLFAVYSKASPNYSLLFVICLFFLGLFFILSKNIRLKSEEVLVKIKDKVSSELYLKDQSLIGNRRTELLNYYRQKLFVYSLISVFYWLVLCLLFILVGFSDRPISGSILVSVLFIIFVFMEDHTLDGDFLRNIPRLWVDRRDAFIAISYLKQLDSTNHIAKNELFKKSAFSEFWLKSDMSILDLIHRINETKVHFEFLKDKKKWVLCDGYRASSTQLNLAGFISALINLGFLSKSITINKESACTLKEIFYIPEQKSEKELQKLYGQGFKDIDVNYSKYFEELIA